MTPKTCDEMRTLIGKFLSTAPGYEASRLWDIITCQRGPDSPSERGDMSPTEASQAYAGRRARKRETVEVIRAQSFGGVVGGAARSRKDINYVVVPPEKERDHFDRHVVKAAQALGLEVRVKEEEKGDKGCEVKMLQPAIEEAEEPVVVPLKKKLWSKKTPLQKAETSVLHWAMVVTAYKDTLNDSLKVASLTPSQLQGKKIGYANALMMLKAKQTALAKLQQEEKETYYHIEHNPFNQLLYQDGAGSGASFDVETPVKQEEEDESDPF